MVKALELRLVRSRVTPGRSGVTQRPWASCSHTYASVTKQYILTPAVAGQAGSDILQLGMSGVALAMRRGLKWFIHERAQGL